ncbi:hypothetical protein RSOLAG22IIIB_10945 [Rhizoctonia solani]|uniref:Phytocyanin domain-containing protein n=1 Tax=Rhizoctonia solani TaxID=456999 RepID=A0A0K6G633_9AGAM|nr:hypothetical protein RSOLAG22IIIB_10945 [Rhizoctonia solani]
MYFSIPSIISTIIFVLLLTGVIANPIRSAGHLRLETRTEWDSPKTHKVTVGAWGKLLYDPEYVHAKVGDYMQFEFHPKNHTVTESSFVKPCSAIDGGFRTGFVAVKEEKGDNLPVRKFKVVDDKPHWFYCGQVGHCPAGMVFAVNPPKNGNTFEKFEEKAKESGGKW